MSGFFCQNSVVIELLLFLLQAKMIINGVCSVWLVGWFLTKHRNLKIMNQCLLIKKFKRKYINEAMESGSFSDSYKQNSSSFTPQTHRHIHVAGLGFF